MVKKLYNDNVVVNRTELEEDECKEEDENMEKALPRKNQPGFTLDPMKHRWIKQQVLEIKSSALSKKDKIEILVPIFRQAKLIPDSIYKKPWAQVYAIVEDAAKTVITTPELIEEPKQIEMFNKADSGMTTTGTGSGVITEGLGSYPKTKKKLRKKRIALNKAVMARDTSLISALRNEIERIQKARTIGAKDKQKRKAKEEKINLEELQEQYNAAQDRDDKKEIERLGYLLSKYEKLEKCSGRKHTPIVSMAQKRLFYSVVGGNSKAAPGLSRAEAKRHLKEAKGKKLPEKVKKQKSIKFPKMRGTK